jgi:hypothetical protein
MEIRLRLAARSMIRCASAAEAAIPAESFGARQVRMWKELNAKMALQAGETPQASQRDLAALRGICRRLQLPPLERRVLGRLHLRQQVVGPLQLTGSKSCFDLALQLGHVGVVTGGGRGLRESLLVVLGDLDELRFQSLGRDLGFAQCPDTSYQD